VFYEPIIILNRIESYRVGDSLKIPKKKQRIKLPNLFQIKKTDFFKQILQSTIFNQFLFLNKVSSYSTPVIHVIDEYYTTRPYLRIKID